MVTESYKTAVAAMRQISVFEFASIHIFAYGGFAGM